MTHHSIPWPDEALVESAHWPAAKPRLSVLIPFKGDDPSGLLIALARETADAEIIVLDDGSNDEALARRVGDTVTSLALPARLVRLTVNEGRAKGRNRLARHARGQWLLFLDADMLPDRECFLGHWLALIETDAPDVAFGGFSLDQTPRTPQHALHRTMALKSDCLPAATRRQAPEKYVFTSNLLVARPVFEAVGFDEGFVGWGWEDVEWAMRVAARWPIVHVDNTATHLGLDVAADLARKYEQSAANFGRVVAAHPAIAAQYPSYRWARRLRALPLRGLWRPSLKALALSPLAPLKLRDLALRFYRAALYAETL
ncbi:glycosyltransferase involved in cell wall biosynthesis [Caulobacter ginsengisoli]|uniref:Glycosyltransferase involved in cell wall biosynthesis n=1 Tax=Caulobacter ginsengisoli TaxID=400775 RepID=A0ABU0IRU3_9CAUL|nr:glycosyltransferase family 2 protein [Caulobacter ginsengisoli]MDQ0464130.1 glycosyltransferase involved in cell wall biosynthesis [Caulobacter ginsengisoli]